MPTPAMGGNGALGDALYRVRARPIPHPHMRGVPRASARFLLNQDEIEHRFDLI